MRRFRAKETPEAKAARYEQKNAARRNPNSAIYRPPGQCTKCKRIFPLTTEFFVALRVKGHDYLSAECRECRNKRIRAHYRDNREYHIDRALDYVKANP